MVYVAEEVFPSEIDFDSPRVHGYVSDESKVARQDESVFNKNVLQKVSIR